jgi:hypothetical protein
MADFFFRGVAMRLALPVLLGCAPLAAVAQGGSPCWYSAEALNRHFGAHFAAGKPEPDQGLGPACVYKDESRSLSFFVGTSPADKGMPPEMLRKFLIGPRNKAVPIPGDADGAAIVQHGGDVPPFPSVIYERKGHTLFLHVTGMWDSGHADKQAAIKAWNQKLAKLPRVPQ